MLLVKHTRIQNLTSIRPQKVDLQILRIPKLQRRITKLIPIRKHIGRKISTHITQSLDVASTSRDDICRCFGILESSSIGDIVVCRIEALGIVHVAEYTEIDAVFVEEGFEGFLAG